ncbi:MAG TPA: penicillin-binding transpeptidase domain-containing protein [Verrucomicrobiae bacterium]|nr:penicillin-binding transpeptidase domain-containing protein [Verrucomicrobiae bacterium]
MLIFDQLRRNDPALRLLALGIFLGLVTLGAGLWWVQIVSYRDYQANLETQAFRTIRIPAVRGKIMDQNGATLADNVPTFNVSLYLEELKDQFREEYARIRPREVVTNNPPAWKFWASGSQVRTQATRLKRDQLDVLYWEARFRVASNAVAKISSDLNKPLSFNPATFKRHYLTRLALPYPVAERLTPAEIARFEEKTSSTRGVDLEIQSTRNYPQTNTAAHLLGHLRQSDELDEGEPSVFDYRLPDFRGVTGVEFAYDSELHGRAGAKSVLVNNLGYRQTENTWSPAEPGRDVVMTLDLQVQLAAERALQNAAAAKPVRGAAVVMDVNTGDILAMASEPSFDPGFFVNRRAFPPGYYNQLQTVNAEKNRATQENYRPGSIFKPIVALACLESGLDPDDTYKVQPYTRNAGLGGIFVGRREIRDTAPPGDYNFRRALIHSSNAYFIHYGLRAGVDRIAEMGRRLHLGERSELGTRQEISGTFPDQRRISRGWTDGDTANLCIGQGYIDVTPLQMTVVASALANGGKVLWPRLVARVDPSAFDPTSQPTTFPSGRVRDQLSVRASTLRILGEAMLADTEDPEGTAYHAFRNWQHQKVMRVCGKTGTAQIQNERNQTIGLTTWFLSFAPYENPRYAVVVMVENGSSGGGTCAPLARQIYDALVTRDQSRTPRQSVAHAN